MVILANFGHALPCPPKNIMITLQVLWSTNYMQNINTIAHLTSRYQELANIGTLWACPGMPDHTHVHIWTWQYKYHDKLVALKNIYFNANYYILLYILLYVLIIARCKVQYRKYFPKFLIFHSSFHEPLGEWNNSEI